MNVPESDSALPCADRSEAKERHPLLLLPSDKVPGISITPSTGIHTYLFREKEGILRLKTRRTSS